MSEIGTKFLLVMLIIFLGVITVFLTLRVISLSEYAQQTDELRMGTEDLLYDSIGMNCKNNAGSLDVTLDCLYTAFSYKDVIEMDFNNFYDATYDGEGGSGFIILRNDALQVYESSNFRLYQNKELVDSACHLEGEIRSGYTCKLEFPRKCEVGDILEVKYVDESEKEILVLLHVCEYR